MHFGNTSLLLALCCTLTVSVFAEKPLPNENDPSVRAASDARAAAPDGGPADSRSPGNERVDIDGVRSFVPGTEVEEGVRAFAESADVLFPALLRYFNADSWPSGGIAVAENEKVSRTNALIAVRASQLNGGGYATNGLIMRKRWIFEFLGPDPATGDLKTWDSWVMEWKYRQLDYQYGYYYSNCWNGWPCAWGASGPTYLEDVTSSMDLTCPKKLGPGWVGRIRYEYSTREFPRDGFGWDADEPAIEPFAQPWELDFYIDALRIVTQPSAHPEIEDTAPTGYKLVAPYVAPNTFDFIVQARDCDLIANAPFKVTRSLVEGSAGHGHVTSGDRQPDNLDRVGKLTAAQDPQNTYSGKTDSSGEWKTTFTSGPIAGMLRFQAEGTLLGRSFTAEPESVMVGFRRLTDPGVGAGDAIRYTGTESAVGKNHLANHFGSPELHTFVRSIARLYNELEQDTGGDPGSFGINDMSIEYGGLFDYKGNWLRPHQRHRFGTDSDIDKRRLTPDGRRVRINTRVLTLVVERKLNGILIVERNNNDNLHVQVPEYMVGEILLREVQ